jgi:hypothetical protein
MRFYIPNYDIYRTGLQELEKGGIAVALKGCIPYTYVDLPPLLSIEIIEVFVLIVNTEILLAAVYKYSKRVLSETDITQFLGVTNKSNMAADLNAKHAIWNSQASKPSDMKQLGLSVTRSSESQRHNALLITFLTVGVMLWTLWSITISNCQRPLSLISWTQITYQ